METSRRISGAAAVGTSLLLLSGCLAFHPEPLPGAPSDATFAQLGDTQVHYLDAGSGEETLVLVHGFGATIAEWAPMVPALVDAGFRVVALDLRGHGWSTRPDGDYSIEAQARLVLALLDQLGIDRFTVVGHSWGSAIALRLAMQASERVERVALFGGIYFEDQQPLIFHWARLPLLGEVIYGAFYTERSDEKMTWAFYDPSTHVTEDVAERLEELMARPGTEAAALAGVRAMDFAALEEGYAEIAQPVLVVWGREDRITPLAWGERIAAELGNARLVVLPQCGHIPMVEWPHASSQHLLRFLAEGEG